MSTAYEIPLSATPQTFQITIVGVAYNLNVRWNSQNQTWMLDINDQSGNPIVNGIPLVTGVDLLGQFGYLNFGFQLYAETDHAPLTPPTYVNLGSTGHLYVVTP